jgi:hypothetical protein
MPAYGQRELKKDLSGEDVVELQIVFKYIYVFKHLS